MRVHFSYLSVPASGRHRDPRGRHAVTPLGELVGHRRTIRLMSDMQAQNAAWSHDRERASIIRHRAFAPPMD